MDKELLSRLLHKLTEGLDLEGSEAKTLMQSIMTGEAGETLTAALLTALACKGESASEIAAFAQVMRQAAQSWPPYGEGEAPSVLCDTCGTGGDGASTMNISTLAAIILASLGIPVAKHGNRAVSSKNGSADILEQLGIKLDLSPQDVRKCLEEIGITFLFAPRWHPAMKYAVPVRQALKVRTVFNLLGPISNPAPISHQIVGVFDRSFQKVIAQALAQLEGQAYVLCSVDGLDELSWAAPTHFIRVGQGCIQEEGELSPEDFAFARHPRDLLQISSPEEAKERSLQFLAGKGSQAENHAVAMNTALLYALLTGEDLKTAAQSCLKAIEEGRGLELLERWRAFA